MMLLFAQLAKELWRRVRILLLYIRSATGKIMLLFAQLAKELWRRVPILLLYIWAYRDRVGTWQWVVKAVWLHRILCLIWAFTNALKTRKQRTIPPACPRLPHF